MSLKEILIFVKHRSKLAKGQDVNPGNRNKVIVTTFL